MTQQEDVSVRMEFDLATLKALCAAVEEGGSDTIAMRIEVPRNGPPKVPCEVMARKRPANYNNAATRYRLGRLAEGGQEMFSVTPVPPVMQRINVSPKEEALPRRSLTEHFKALRTTAPAAGGENADDVPPKLTTDDYFEPPLGQRRSVEKVHFDYAGIECLLWLRGDGWRAALRQDKRDEFLALKNGEKVYVYRTRTEARLAASKVAQSVANRLFLAANKPTPCGNCGGPTKLHSRRQKPMFRKYCSDDCAKQMNNQG